MNHPVTGLSFDIRCMDDKAPVYRQGYNVHCPAVFTPFALICRETAGLLQLFIQG